MGRLLALLKSLTTVENLEQWSAMLVYSTEYGLAALMSELPQEGANLESRL